MAMTWTRLMSPERPLADAPPEPPAVEEARGPFRKDADRIIYSAAFRRLQDKTQVQPFPGSDYLRTRLTHSLESASVGRSLGGAVGRQVLARHGPLEVLGYRLGQEDFGEAVAAACLAHDIGSPPFGHAGEDAIRHWFTHEGAACLDRSFTAAERHDLEGFEANAQGFRILTRLQVWRERGGMRLSAATLGTFSKYPHGSAAAGAEGRAKFGYVQADRPAFTALATTLGLLPAGDGAFRRHPLAYLVEAADDICYNVADLEDGVKAGKVRFAEAEAPLRAIAGPELAHYRDIADDMDRIGYLRAKAIGALIGQAQQVFLDGEAAILAGRFSGGLLDHAANRAELDRVRLLCRERLFHDPVKLEAELGGFEVVRGLLDVFGPPLDRLAACDFDAERLAARDRRVIRILPGLELGPSTRYGSMLRLADYVSGMSDRFAVALHRRLTGQLIGSGSF